MSPTRRTCLRILGASLLAGVTALAGCTGAAPRTDGGGDAADDGNGTSADGGGDDGLPDSSDDSGAGGTRPEGTGGPGATIASVDDAPDLPVRPDVELVRDTATAEHPPQLRTTLTNTTDATVRVGEGRAVHFAYVTSESGQLMLLPGEGDYPAAPDCWRLTDDIAVTQEYRMLDIAPDEPSTRLLDLYGAPTDEDACLPVGEHRFETTIAVLTESGEQESSATWGFSVRLE